MLLVSFSRQPFGLEVGLWSTLWAWDLPPPLFHRLDFRAPLQVPGLNSGLP